MDEGRTEQLANLQSLGAGAVDEKFQAELRAVLENIKDPNTEATAKRKIVLEFVFIPDKKREVVQALISARSVFAATQPTSEVMFVGRQAGEIVATVIHGAQPGEDVAQRVLQLTPTREASDG